MKEQDRLRKLFDQARSEEPVLKKDQIDHLVKSEKKVSADKIRLGKPGRGLFNPLNLIIMISTIAFITSLVVIFSINRSEQSEKFVPGPHIYEYSIEQTDDADARESKPEAIKTRIKRKEKLKEESRKISPGIFKHDTLGEVFARDTVIIGEILHLSKEKLERLGFEFNEKGYYYLNELPDGSKINLWSYLKNDQVNKASSVGFGRGGYVNPVIKKEPTKRDYYPVCTSNLKGDDIRGMQGLPELFVENFEYHNDTLVPIVLTWTELGGKKYVSSLAWFKLSDNFFTDLGPGYNNLYEIYKLKRDNPGTMVIYDFSSLHLDIGKAIMLDSLLMPSMGFTITSDSLFYQYGSAPSGVKFWFTSGNMGLQALGAPDIMIDLEDEDKPLLCAVTNLKINMSMNVNPQSYYEVDSTINGDNWIDICVPIRFNNSNGQFWDGNTFWFYPNEDLFNILPDSIGGPMAKEFNLNVIPKLRGTDLNYKPIFGGIMAPDSIYNRKGAEKTVACEYFPSFCEGLPGLDDLNVYPNPVSDILNMEITVSRGKNIDFRVFDIGGRLVIDNMDTKNFTGAGMYRHQMDVSSLEEGFYLLVLTDEEGNRMTRRLIKN